ncbi:YybH family protein [Longimicrobium sp.]|uniref:YybH family protein n=1 Tax=Longimicrobium sp. TaxID=2029185 RepID=UPI003B3A7060
MLPRLTILMASAALLAPVASAAQVNLNAARESLRAADHAVSAAAETHGLLNGLAPHLADSAYVLLPGLPLLQGRDVVAGWLDRPPFRGMRLKLEPVRVDVSADGGSGYTFGGGTRTNDDGAVPARYIAYWIQDGGGWKLAAFHFNASPQPATPPPPGFFPDPPATGVAQPGADMAAALEQIMQTDRDFSALSVARNPGVAFAAYVAPDGALLGGAYGPEAVGAVFAGGGATLEWEPVAGGMAASGDLGYTVGLGVSRGGNGVGYSKYLSIWRRQPNGEWKWVVDGGNPRPADPVEPVPGGA